MARRADAAESRGPRASQKAHQHGLGLVVPRVPQRHDRLSAARQAEQESQPHRARELLEGGRAALARREWLAAAQVKAQVETPGQRFGDRGVPLSPAAAQTVVEVGDLEGDPEARPGRKKQMHQARRVSAARKRRNDPRARRHEPMASRIGQEIREQRRLHESEAPGFHPASRSCCSRLCPTRLPRRVLSGGGAKIHGGDVLLANGIAYAAGRLSYKGRFFA